MKYYVKIDCKDNHTFRLFKNYLEDKFELVTSFTFEKSTIFVLCEDLGVAERVYDMVAYQIDMWSDIKVLELKIGDLA